MSSLIEAAAALIAEYDPAAAQAFRTQTFRRKQIAKAFRGGFKVHTELTLKVCSAIDRAAEMDAAERLAEFRDIWADSVSASVLADYAAGRAVEIKAGA